MTQVEGDLTTTPVHQTVGLCARLKVVRPCRDDHSSLSFGSDGLKSRDTRTSFTDNCLDRLHPHHLLPHNLLSVYPKRHIQPFSVSRCDDLNQVYSTSFNFFFFELFTKETLSQTYRSKIPIQRVSTGYKYEETFSVGR